MQDSVRLALSHICKSFPGVLANDDVSLNVREGEIHALLGENGAGKSTLVKIIYGLLKPDAGEIHWQGQRVSIDGPNVARSLGIGMVFQHFSLFDALSVGENIALALHDKSNMRELGERVAAISESYGLSIDVNREVHTLSVGERQRVEIVRCLLQDPQLIIMDEPTSMLTPQEVTSLFNTLNKLKAEGRSILYISHKLEEISTLCERATILRQGRVVAECDPKETSAKQLAELMIGGDLASPTAKMSVLGDLKLKVKGLRQSQQTHNAIELKNISLEVRAGEVVGIAGVAGNGQSELLAVLSGERNNADFEVLQICGEDAGHLNINQRRVLGMAYVPEERLGHGAVSSMSLIDNAVLGNGNKGNGWFVNYSQHKSEARSITDTFDVRHTGIQSIASSLSGGNLQKFIVGREILRKPELILVAQPTWGADAGSAATIHQALLDLAAQGSAVLIVSQDLDELITLCDRIAVLFTGTLSKAQPTATVTPESLGLLMGGAGMQADLQRSHSIHDGE